MNIVFCVDRGALPGLHVAAHSLLERFDVRAGSVRFFVFSDELDEADIALLRRTLLATRKSFSVELCRVDASQFAGLPQLHGSQATYHRLLAAEVLDVERFLCLDVDIACHLDVSELDRVDLRGETIACVAEAPLHWAVDRQVADYLGNHPHLYYYNTGVMLVDVAAWRRQRLTHRVLEYVAAHNPPFREQSALNAVLSGHIVPLEERFNLVTTFRKHWRTLRHADERIGCVVHFADFPKPWSLLGEWLHPQYRLWRAALDKTALRDFRSWHATPTRKFPQTRRAWSGYQKMLKERIRFGGYERGWIKRVRGVPA